MIEQIVNLLNEAAQLDPRCVRDLIEHRVPCNAGLAEHPTIQVFPVNGQDCVGLLGFMNGLIDPKQERILAHVDDASVRFEAATPQTHPQYF